ncbi:membrane protein [methanotrophic bacterial endosymbiont of Bathymodiolus sp.]|nr:membrane protein [methanotrophic bacterial endosymbiont of Bathymodiolus sp.]
MLIIIALLSIYFVYSMPMKNFFSREFIATLMILLAMTGKYIASMLVNYSLSKNSMNNMKSGKSAKLMLLE